jgi:RimJ/RimL family protein N-acetyltransferase
MNKQKKDESVEIRKIKDSDAVALYNILDDLDEKTKGFFHPHSFDYYTINEICNSDKDHYYVMLLDNELIGYSFLRLFGYEIPSYGLIIKKGYQRKGYGTILAKWCIKKAKELGYKRVILKTYKENISAQKIYKKLGFRIVGETKDKKQYKMELEL